MLLSWHDRLLLAITPEQLVLRHAKAGWRPQFADIALTVDTAATPGWQALLPQLEQLLHSRQWQRPVLSVVLSNRLARYQLLPWSDELHGAAEWLALARHSYRQVFGELAAGWRYRLSGSGYGRPVLACAIDEALLAGLQGICERLAIRLQLVQPYLMVAFNLWRKQLNVQDGGLLLAEPGLLSLASFRQGSWQSLLFETLPAGQPGAASLALHRMLLQLEQAQLPSELATFTPGHAIAPTRPSPRLRALQLPDDAGRPGAALAACYGMAASGGGR
ncbi:hypothetical protein ACFOLG_01215 [Vogesella facilis]|uniref:Uncharacterized protein n=1 Tax=Vogesella facilis TaxID=1655232 RepID=A0ABV7R9A2_9NEIS